MKKIFLSLFLVTGAAITFAQKETFDLTTYTPPKGWKKELTENTITYTIISKQTNSWCRINIVKSTASKGNIDQDFESEWQELVVKSYNVTDTPQINTVQDVEGWKIKAGGGKFMFNNNTAMAMLTTISGYNRCVSIVSTTNSQGYIKDIETLLSSVDLIKPNINEPLQTDVSDTKSVLGNWGATASDQSSFRVKNGVMNYISRQYYFKSNNTYTFVSKAIDPLMNKILLGKENGTYEVTGNTVIITPKKSVLEAWSKKDGADNWGKLLSSQNIPLEKVSYHFTKHYFSGIRETALILQSDKPTQRDGAYSGNVTVNNSWIYSPLSNSHPVISLPAGQ